MRAMRLVPVMVGLMAALTMAQQRGGRATAPAQSAAPTSVVLEAHCASDLGKGVKTAREFCDVIVAATGDDSMSMRVPAHTGPASLFFDLHPRFEITGPDGDPARLFQRHTSVVAVVGPTGDVIDRAAVAGEFRSTADLFDRMSGSGPGAFKVVAPGLPTPIKVAVPASVTSVGIVGLRVEILSRFNMRAFPEPGRPVAIVSNWRIEFVPR